MNVFCLCDAANAITYTHQYRRRHKSNEQCFWTTTNGDTSKHTRISRPSINQQKNNKINSDIFFIVVAAIYSLLKFCLFFFAIFFRSVHHVRSVHSLDPHSHAGKSVFITIVCISRCDRCDASHSISECEWVEECCVASAFAVEISSRDLLPSFCCSFALSLVCPSSRYGSRFSRVREFVSNTSAGCKYSTRAPYSHNYFSAYFFFVVSALLWIV